MNEADERAFIQKAVASILATTGQRPFGWLSRYLLTENTRRLLAEAGFTYHMDDYSDDQPFWDMVTTATGPKPMVIMPYALDSNDMKMWTDPALKPDQWLKYAIDTFEWLYAEGPDAPRMMSFGVHLRIVGRPGRIGVFEAFLKYVKSRAGVWITTRADIAAHFAKSVSAPSA